MKKLLFLFSLAFMIVSAPVYAKVKVVAATEDLGSITESVGGNRVEVTSLSRGTQDPHRVEPRPSQVMTLARAQVFARIGMDLDMWADGLLNAAHNTQIRRGGLGYVDCSVGIHKLEVPSGKLDPSMGDIHLYGNPHYWLDPSNGILIAHNIMKGLCRVDPSGAVEYKQNYVRFAKGMVADQARWKKELAPYAGMKIVTYHRTWPYFLHRFNLVSFGEIELKPGIPASPSHIASLAARMKKAGVKVIVVEHFYPAKTAELVARQAGARVVVVPVATGGEKGINNYAEMLNTVVSRISKALAESK